MGEQCRRLLNGNGEAEGTTDAAQLPAFPPILPKKAEVPLSYARLSKNDTGIVPRPLVRRRTNTYILLMKEPLKDRQARRAIEGVQAMADYQAAAKATLAKTARLKAERLAREAVIVPEVPKKKAAPRKRSTASSSAIQPS
jgi:hypothetical protein